MENKLEEARKIINDADAKMAELFIERMRAAEMVYEHKKELNMSDKNTKNLNILYSKYTSPKRLIASLKRNHEETEVKKETTTKNWLDNVDNATKVECIKKCFTDVMCKNSSPESYGSYFAFRGSLPDGTGSVNDKTFYLGQYGPITRTGFERGILHGTFGEITNPEDDFRTLLSATGREKVIYIKWINMVAKANEGIVDEQGRTYMEALKDAIKEYIRQTKRNLDADTARIIEEKKAQTSKLLARLEEEAIIKQ